jgi:light-regulated signal transduction histidine kinase (bacteriophytochrome)
VKPFAFPELLARIRALLRRGRTDQLLRLKVGDLEMDLVTRKVTRGTRTLELTAREYDLLEYLLRHHNQLVSREMLTRDVWKEPSRVTPLDNVIDIGPGIEIEHHNRIFDRFYRVDKARARELGGTGLGLAIARWAVEVHGGRIELESQKGRGSTFAITLPRSQRPEQKGVLT